MPTILRIPYKGRSQYASEPLERQASDHVFFSNIDAVSVTKMSLSKKNRSQKVHISNKYHTKHDIDGGVA